MFSLYSNLINCRKPLLMESCQVYFSKYNLPRGGKYSKNWSSFGKICTYHLFGLKKNKIKKFAITPHDIYLLLKPWDIKLNIGFPSSRCFSWGYYQGDKRRIFSSSLYSSWFLYRSTSISGIIQEFKRVHERTGLRRHSDKYNDYNNIIRWRSVLVHGRSNKNGWNL